jgi:hypothetical protein
VSGIFSATIFNRAVFNTGEAVSLNVGAGGDVGELRKRQRFFVKIDGELTDVSSPEEAIFLLEDLKKEKLKEVRRVARKQANLEPTKRSEFLEIPVIQARNLPQEAEIRKTEINRELEIAYWMMFEQAIIAARQIEDEDDELLLSL